MDESVLPKESTFPCASVSFTENTGKTSINEREDEAQEAGRSGPFSEEGAHLTLSFPKD